MPLASRYINYNAPGGSYGADFFLDNRPAKIVMHYEPNKKNELVATSIRNATLIYDIGTNATWAKLQKFKNDSVMAKENRPFLDLRYHHDSNESQPFSINGAIEHMLMR